MNQAGEHEHSKGNLLIVNANLFFNTKGNGGKTACLSRC